MDGEAEPKIHRLDVIRQTLGLNYGSNTPGAIQKEKHISTHNKIDKLMKISSLNSYSSDKQLC